MPTRNDAYQLMTNHVKNENLQKHMLSVEVALRFYARKYSEDEELWAMTGLLHDLVTTSKLSMLSWRTMISTLRPIPAAPYLPMPCMPAMR